MDWEEERRRRMAERRLQDGERIEKPGKGQTITFRVADDTAKALEDYMADHPRETRSGMILDLIEQELALLGYLEPRRRDLFSITPGEPDPDLEDRLARLANDLQREARRLAARRSDEGKNG